MEAASGPLNILHVFRAPVGGLFRHVVDLARGQAARGHKVSVTPSPWGGAQIVNIDWDRGVLIAGSEPRKDGCALGY